MGKVRRMTCIPKGLLQINYRLHRLWLKTFHKDRCLVSHKHKVGESNAAHRSLGSAIKPHLVIQVQMWKRICNGVAV